MKTKKINNGLPFLKEMLTADREKLNKDYSEISERQSRCKYGSRLWKSCNDCLNVIRIELEHRAMGK